MNYGKKIGIVILPDYYMDNPYTNTPDAQVRLYTLFKMAGYRNVQVVDLRFCTDDKELLNMFAVRVQGYDCVMFSAVTAQMNAIRILSRCSKKFYPNCKTILGGSHINAILDSNVWTCTPEELHPYIDVYARGYYWQVKHIEELCNFIFSSNGYGLWHGDYNDDFKETIIPMQYECLDRNYKSVEGGVIRQGNLGTISTQNMLITHGCTFKCAFCYNDCRNLYLPTPNSVVDELERRVKVYDIQGIKISDDDTFWNLNWNDMFIKELASRNVHLVYLASTRCDVHREKYRKLEQLIKMNKLGLKVLGIGVEWASDDVLTAINKHVSVKRIKETIKLLHDYTDIEILCYSIFGLPCFNDRTFNEMIEFVMWARGKVKHINMTNFVPLIATPIYECPANYNMTLSVPRFEKGMDCTKIDWSEFYFTGKFDTIHALPNGVNADKFIDYKIQMYRVMKKCGFLRKQTELDAVRCGYTI